MTSINLIGADSIVYHSVFYNYSSAKIIAQIIVSETCVYHEVLQCSTLAILNGNSNVNSFPSLSINWMLKQFAHRTVFKMGILLFSLLFKLKLLLIH